MTTETEQHPTWGEEPPQAAAPGSGWNGRKTLAAVAIAVGIAAVGGGVIYAASNSEAAQNSMGGPGGYGMRGGPGMMIMGSPFGETTHGEFQNGEVTEVGDASITVQSSDGFSETYKIDGDTQVNGGQGALDDIAKGDTVTIIAAAAEDGGEATVETIMEGNAQRGGPQMGNGQPPANQQGTPPTR
ncbi:hypothetical protein ALI22I_45880 [Saccharothrix sp. ALI-22-I]|uniref:hypothetical protein n=1 Tax=Saccharothrix sp. ALI-22-I TaxID=1933778 RepID=UPI00097BE761|nr:hypothetical protein [Saccharothrix sp. ALI-22-I]ONI80601.1 hypothetical protein ALI22I_45880 [Saccharothrix sp. ALI-22-I]